MFNYNYNLMIASVFDNVLKKDAGGTRDVFDVTLILVLALLNHEPS